MRRKLEHLAARQEAILSCIQREIVKRGEASMVREIARTPGPVQYVVGGLSAARAAERRGEITREARRPRASRLGR